MRRKDIRTAIKVVYGKLWNLLSLYETTDCFNEVPNGEMAKNAWEYMGSKLLEVKKTVNTLFLGEETLAIKLNEIVDETEYFVRRYEVPGVVKRWKQINPRLLYFDCAFDLMEKNPEIYRTMSRGLSDLSLSCYPDEDLIEDRKAYFNEIKRKNEEDNLQYSDVQIFLNELLHTLTFLFEEDFKDYL